MSQKAKLAQLKALAELVRERELAQLRQHQANRAHIEAQLAALDQTGLGRGLDPVIAAQVEQRYGLWVLNRRIGLNRKLALEMVRGIEAREKAQIAFGRAEALTKLAK